MDERCRLAWFGGIVDGEGTIGIKKIEGRYYQFEVSVGNTNGGLVSTVDAVFRDVGVPNEVYRVRSHNPRAKDCWISRVSNREAVGAALAAVHPYLVTKIDQADLALRALSEGCTEEHFLAMAVLNKRGLEGRVRSSSQGLGSLPLNLRLAWLGGVVDGEGSLSLNLVHGKTKSGKISELARFEVHVANTNENMLEEVMSIARTSGVGCCFVRGKPRPTERPTNRVVFLGMPRVKGMLLAVRPYLVSKAELAGLMLAAIEHREQSKIVHRALDPAVHGRYGGGYSPVREDEVLLSYVAEMGRLNRRGRIPTSGGDMIQVSARDRTTSLGSPSVNVVGAAPEQENPHPQGNRYTDERSVV